MDLPSPPPFRPALWARSPHLQTVLGHVLRDTSVTLAWEPARLDLDDGEALTLRVLPGGSGRAVVLFHGLGGHAGSAYMRRAAGVAAARDHAVVAVNHRGVAEGRGLAIRPYHSGATGDVAAVIAWTRARWPGTHLTAVGFSISANILLLLLGRDRHLAQPDAAIAVNPPGDLDAGSRRLAEGLNRLYDRRFVRLVRHEVTGRPQAGFLQPTPTLRAFDEVYTAPAAGFRDRADYYARCSCGPHLAGIRIPTVVIASADDPFAPASDLGPVSDAVHLHVEPHGGHMGYLGAPAGPGGSRHWLDAALDHYLRCLGPGGEAGQRASAAGP